MKSALFIVLVVLFGLSGGSAADELRGERVGWARLRTPSEYWRRHATGDLALMRFMRGSTSLNIDPTWYVADVDKLDELCAYPLLFSQGISTVENPGAKANLGEYVRRGGFLLIDCCINVGITPSANAFLREQVRTLAGVLPEARVVALPSTHNIYQCYFQIPGGRPPHTFNNNVQPRVRQARALRDHGRLAVGGHHQPEWIAVRLGRHDRPAGPRPGLHADAREHLRVRHAARRLGRVVPG